MTVDSCKLLDLSTSTSSRVSQLQFRDNSTMLSRSDSSCSMEHFLPTFESEDYDWVRFGWLLESTDIDLPCIEDDRKAAAEHAKASKDEELVFKNDVMHIDGMDVDDKHDLCKRGAKSVDSTEFYLSDFDDADFEDARRKHSLKYYDDLGPTSVGGMSPEELAQPESPFQPQVDLVDGRFEERPDLSPTHSYVESTTSEDTTPWSQTLGDEGTEETNTIRDSITPPAPEESSVVLLKEEKKEDQKKEEEEQKEEKEEKRKDEKEEDDEDEEPIAKRTRRATFSEDVFAKSETAIKRKPSFRRRCGTQPRQRSYRKKLYCVCQTPYNRILLYVGCDGCRGWFHPTCVGITDRQAVEAKKFFCPKCAKGKVFSDDG